jgi:CBS domain
MTKSGHPRAARPDVADDDPFVASLMTTPVVAIVPDAPLAVALRLLATRRVRHLPVVDGSRCLGVLLDTEIAHLLAYSPRPTKVPSLYAADVCRTAPEVHARDDVPPRRPGCGTRTSTSPSSWTATDSSGSSRAPISSVRSPPTSLLLHRLIQPGFGTSVPPSRTRSH